MKYAKSLVAIAASADLPKINQLSRRFRHTEVDFSVPLSPDGSLPITHYGLHAWVTDPCTNRLARGQPSGMTVGATRAARKNLTFSLRDSADNHFDGVIGQARLVRVVIP
ncbi:hypothetical protein [Parvularcula lutaonensis]|uniref:Uncharacterized protein n=1 Tax=Parvularcula lutaonensis TaxID=491923 RepID=A0ABV7MEP9_9PROT|nr:hypothetical protein [Parvularcula lutaonensis]GGY51557.1 hypothetical protein GCM10007148_20580 [Parvularcula lutaonensis]